MGLAITLMCASDNAMQTLSMGPGGRIDADQIGRSRLRGNIAQKISA
jgi:hypothetical protein